MQQPGYGGGGAVNTDAFVVKFNSLGVRLWATYYGGNQSETGNGIATDVNNNVVITGRTDGAFPVGTSGAPNVVQQPGYGGGGGNTDAFVVKFNSFGVRQWATYYGGNTNEISYGIATDAVGNVVITGFTYGSFPVGTSGAPNVVQQPGYGGNGDVFVVKFNPFGVMQWATYYGGSIDEWGYGIATDNLSNVVITGYTNGAFPVGTSGAPNVVQQAGYGGSDDVFVVKLNSFGVMQWATYYGGSKQDWGYGIATDNLGNVVVTGYTLGAFPVGTNGAPNVVQQPVYGGGADDAFVVKFNPFGVMQWATYYGGSTPDWAFSVETDGNNNVYVLMEPEDVPGPALVDACTWQPDYGGYEDQVIVKFNPIGKKLCATYMGGKYEDELEYGGKMIAIYGNSLYITGTCNGGGYPTTPGVAQPVFGGGMDAFVAQLCTNICEGKTLGLNFSASATSVCNNKPVTFTPTIANSCDTTGYRFHWTFSGGSPSTSDSVNPTVTYSNPGQYDVKLVVTTVCKKDSVTNTKYITVNNCGCTLTGQFTKGTANCATCGCNEWILVNATGGTSPYSYSWPDGYTNRYKNNLCPGTYVVTIKDKNGCSVNVNLTAP